MKKLPLVVIILLAGCASTDAPTGDSDARVAQLEKKSLALAESEKRCIDGAITRSRDETAGESGTPDTTVELLKQKEAEERDREISQCRAWAYAENAKIAEQERDEYELQAEQERNSASFMAIVTMASPH
jgi:hypothetical protein